LIEFSRTFRLRKAYSKKGRLMTRLNPTSMFSPTSSTSNTPAWVDQPSSSGSANNHLCENLSVRTCGIIAANQQRIRMLAFGLLALGASGFSAAQVTCHAVGGVAECGAPKIGGNWCQTSTVIPGVGSPNVPPCSPTFNETNRCDGGGAAFGNYSLAFIDWITVPPTTICFSPSAINSAPRPKTFTASILREASDFTFRFGTKTPTTFCGISEVAGLTTCTAPVACPAGYATIENVGSDPFCMRQKPEPCKKGNPIQCAGGEKTQTEVDFKDSKGLLEFVRYYTSVGFYTPRGTLAQNTSMGETWRHSYQQQVKLQLPTPSTSEIAVAYVIRPDGDYRYFTKPAGSWVGRLDAPEKLEELVTSSVRTGWRYTTIDDDVEAYDANGVLLSITRKSGRKTDMYYSTASTPTTIAPYAGLLIEVRDDTGRRIQLTYAASGRVASMTTPSGDVFGYRYDGLSLNALAYADFPNGTSKHYLYNETAHVAASIPALSLLTGIENEAAMRYGTYQYDGNARVVKEWHGSGGTIDKLSVTYYSNFLGPTGESTYVDALGTLRTLQFVAIRGIIKDAGMSQPCGTANCSGLNSTSITYDTNGYVDQKIDFKGIITDYDMDVRGLEVRRIDAKGTPQARITETAWHPNFRVPTERRVCAANALNTCPSTAATPNLLSKTVMTYNSRGQLLTSTQIDPSLSSNTRTSTNTYCDAINAVDCPLVGLIRTYDGPRTDATDVTTYAYRMADAADLSYRKGDVWKVTNAAGHVVEYLAYDGAGRVLKMKNPNGVETWMTYNPRGWLLSKTAKGSTLAGDAATTVTYTAFGAVERLTKPDGAFLQYGYDDAQRLISLTDNAGNKIIYTLDNAGNRIAEITNDPSNNVKRSLKREYDQLSRLRASMRAGILTSDPDTKKTSFTFDANGNIDLEIGPNTGSVAGAVGDNDYDPLDRLIKSIQDLGGVAAKLEYGYDALSRLTVVNDPMLRNTVYAYDGLGNLTSVNSPDAGLTTYAYDAAGNRKQQIDARGVKAAMTFDVLNRLTKIDYTPASSTVINTAKRVQFFYDQADATTACVGSFPIGRMTRFTDESGSTTFCYDRRGNITLKKQVTNSATLSLTTGYNLANQLISMTYPNGTTVGYGRDSLGRISSVTINGAAFISAVSYLPFGPINQISFANGKTLTKTYDQNYDIDAIVSTASGGLNLDYSVDEVGNIVTVNQSGTQFNLGYDKLRRLTAVKDQNNALIEGFTYDATGNRLSRQLGTATPTNYNYSAISNRLSDAGTGARSYDANGNSTQIPGTGTLTYDERNRLNSVVGSLTRTSKYNARGERVMSSVAPINTLTVFGEAAQILSEGPAAASSSALIYLDTLPIARVKAGVINPIETDHLGSPRTLQNAVGSSIVWNWNVLANAATGSNAFGEQAATGSVTDFNLRFPGQVADGNGLSYNYFRDYEASIGRYVESDPIGQKGNINTFTYVENWVLRLIDPRGLASCPVGTESFRSENGKDGATYCRRPITCVDYSCVGNCMQRQNACELVSDPEFIIGAGGIVTIASICTAGAAEALFGFSAVSSGAIGVGVEAGGAYGGVQLAKCPAPGCESQCTKKCGETTFKL
jgi:RHS repeat-associated protein